MDAREGEVMQELKPCPFCGSESIGSSYVETYSVDSSYHIFGCGNCGANFPCYYADGRDVMAAWNKRPYSRAFRKMREALKTIERETIDHIATKIARAALALADKEGE